ncbi:MAG: tetratricopeptide repeat protein, partial [Candidatus Eisenbacteria bacterium]
KGSTPIAAVVLWITRDNGQTWKIYGRDPDLQSPIRFVAEEDGDYGFYIIAATTSWVSSRPDPRPGTPPDRTTRIDTTLPVVHLHTPQGGEAMPAGTSFGIRWTAQDAYLEETPISLFLSGDDGKSWKPLATNLPNTGAFDWVVPPIEGNQFRLRVEARDTCGNMASDMSPYPFSVDNTSLTLEITGIRGVAGGTPQPQEVHEEAPPSAPPVPRDIREARRLYEKGTFLRAQGRLEEAAAAFREAVRNDPQCGDAHNDLGYVLFHLKQYAEARDSFQSALRLAPGDPEILLNLAVACFRTNDTAAAVDALAECLRATTASSPLAARAADILWSASLAAEERGDIETARKAWTLIAELDNPDSRWEGPARDKLRKHRG